MNSKQKSNRLHLMFVLILGTIRNNNSSREITMWSINYFCQLFTEYCCYSGANFSRPQAEGAASQSRMRGHFGGLYGAFKGRTPHPLHRTTRKPLWTWCWSPQCCSSSSFKKVKFMFSKKATKIDEIFTFDLTLCSKCRSDGDDFVHFCSLLRKHELYSYAAIKYKS